ncbi:MAG: hypothetical protein ACXWAC_12485 [Usitatibacter sp.]
MNGIKQVLLMGAFLAAVAVTGCASVGLESSVGDSSATGQPDDILQSMNKDSQGA